jgi:dTDP-4-amino-4,6-dideoxygalactose transaminase
MPPTECEKPDLFQGWPIYEQDEVDAVTEVLLSGKVNYWTGEVCTQFERAFCQFIGTRFGVAVANGTVALEIALIALGIGAGDEVIVPSRTFVASVSVISACGAQPVFADVDPESQNINLESIKSLITSRTKAIILVHLAGWPCDIEPVLVLAKTHNIKIIEDCAQAHGATYNGRQIGGLGDVSAFSFCNDKIISTGGEGGMILTNDQDIWKKFWEYKDHGKCYNKVFHHQHPPGFKWLVDSIGTNGRLTEMQAAIGLRQLIKLPGWLKTRRRHAAMLNEAFRKIHILRTTEPSTKYGHSYYKYYVFVRPERLGTGWSRERIMESICDKGVPCSSGSCPEVYLEKVFDVNGCRPANRLPVAKELGETSLMFPVHPTLSNQAIMRMIEVVSEVCAEAGLVR